MARTFRRREPLSALSEINVTPLIDLAFALLIIFMITAPLLEQSIAVNLPEEAIDAETPVREEAVQEINIDAAGTVFWGARAVELEQLEEELAALALLPEPPVLAIRADREQTVQRLVDVLDLVKKHKLRRVSLETRVR
ncbi:MAG: ExbD/TolR family protein [Opitutales bacterium]